MEAATVARNIPFALAIQALAYVLAESPTHAAPLDPALQQQLLGVYDTYNKAIATEKLDIAMGQMSKRLRTDIQAETKTAKGRREALTMMRAMIPDTISVVHTFVNPGATKARLVTQAVKTMPKGMKIPDAPPPGSVMRSGLTLSFAKEDGTWKFDLQTFGADPMAVTGCKDETAEPRSAYRAESNVSSGGPIVRVAFEPKYTLVVYSVVGEANCAFLPAKADLAEKGVDPAQLQPYAIAIFEGIGHRDDPQKLWAETVEVRPEE